MDGNDSPDGVRFWVNGQLIIDQWVTQESELTSLPISLLADQNYEIRSTVQLVAGNQYDIRIEYFGNLTGAAIHQMRALG
ncbi:PA14 domain-containing protein [Paenibacillus sp. FSL K6-2859]|uniref:PA14 domain-containing protein n=1 Tax=Paenibacillus sp. FSL K6-2859 TaxID=2921482 RepID=UPI0030FA4637